MTRLRASTFGVIVAVGIACGGESVPGPPGSQLVAGADGSASSRGVATAASSTAGDGGRDAGPGPFLRPSGRSPRRPTVDSGTSVYCTDGIRDPATEECDDGNTDDTDACTNTCTVHDVVVWPNPAPTANPPRHGHALGNSHNAVTSSTSVIAVAAHDLDTGGVAVRVLDTHGSDTLSNAHPSMPAEANPLDQPDAAIACTGTVCAVVWTDEDIDGDETGIALARFDAADASAGVVYQAANEVTVSSQHTPDITWTGTAFAVSWTDESNEGPAPDVSVTPVVKVRTFDVNVQPTSGETVLALGGNQGSDATLAHQNGGWVATVAAQPPVVQPAGATPTLAQDGRSWPLATFPLLGEERPSVVGLSSAALNGALLMGYPGRVDDGQVTEGPTGRTFVALAYLAPAGGYVVGVGALYDEPNPMHAASVAAAGADIWVSYERTNAEMGYLQRLDPTTLTFVGPELPLPRAPIAGPIRRSHLATAATGDAMIAVWDDLDHQGDEDEGDEDVELEVLPLPLLRLAPASP